jgi:hypothetical protein
MSAPGCSVVFQKPLQEEELLGFPLLLAPFGTVSPEWKDGWLEIVGDPKEFGCDLEDAQAEVGLCLADPGHAFDMSLEPATQRTLGWKPGQVINVSGINSGMYHHVFVGRVAIAIADRFSSLIHLGEICALEDEPAELSEDSKRLVEKIGADLHPEDRDNPEALYKLFTNPDSRLSPVVREMSESYDRRVREKASQMPGRFFEIADEERHVTYLVDSTFMRHWMRDPGFHIT